MTDITAIILTKNEEVNIERCIKSLRLLGFTELMPMKLLLRNWPLKLLMHVMNIAMMM